SQSSVYSPDLHAFPTRRSSDLNQIAGYIATQLLVWETIVGERDNQFNHVDANAQGKNNVTEYIASNHPLYSQIFSQYSAIENARSEEHTSELQSRFDIVCRLLL